VGKSILPSAYGLLTIAMLLLATPQPAHAYVDPGSGAMLWQILAAAVIGSLFYVRKVFTWVRGHLSFRSNRVTAPSGLDLPGDDNSVEDRKLQMHGGD
jgi:hypothetical protein